MLFHGCRVLAVLAVACLLAGRADAKALASESAQLETARAVAPHGAARAEEPSSSWIDLVARDLQLCAEMGSGSPIRLAEARRTARRRRASRERARDWQVFRSTQIGPFDPIIAAAAERHGIDAFLLKGLLQVESDLDPARIGGRIYAQVGGERRAVGGGARGIAQFTSRGIHAVNEHRLLRYRVGRRVYPFAEADVMDPDRAIPAAAELLASYIARFGRDGGVTAYNTGPAGGRLVAKLGFYRARRTGKLSRLGRKRMQGHRFLLNVLRKTNRLRRAARLRQLPAPRDDRSGVQRHLDRLLWRDWRGALPIS